MKRSLAAACLAALALAGCATSTVYAPMTGPARSGYVTDRIENDRYRITFRGGSDADRNRVANLALLRAAEVTLEQGYDWFRVIDRYGEVRPPRGPNVSIGGGTASYGRHSAVGVGGSFGSIPLGGGPIISETLEIVLSKGTAPREPDAYDAKGVRDSLAP